MLDESYPIVLNKRFQIRDTIPWIFDEVGLNYFPKLAAHFPISIEGYDTRVLRPIKIEHLAKLSIILRIRL